MTDAPPEVAPPGSWRQSTAVAEACASLLRGHRLGRLLDAGGGEGFVTAYLMRGGGVDEAVVFDRDEAILAEVAPPIRTRLGDLESLDHAVGEFSTILLRQVLHYLACPAATLRRLAGRLDPHGVIYVGQLVAPSAAAAAWLGEAAGWISPSRRRVFTQGDLLAIFTSAGLRVTRRRLVAERLALATRATHRPPTARVRATLDVRAEPATLSCRLRFLHAVLRPPGALTLRGGDEAWSAGQFAGESSASSPVSRSARA